MEKKYIWIIVATIIAGFIILIILIQPDVNDEFKEPIHVKIQGYNGDAMEPYISADGSFLFFNSLNDGENTSLFYATKIDATTFVFQGEIEGVNGDPPHLDAVASMDDINHFYFISTRNYPSDYYNLYCGDYNEGKVQDIHSVLGDFYIEETGWLIMDAEISRNGKTLYYVNAHFTGGSVPIESKIGIAHYSNGKFLKDTYSNKIMEKINTWDLNYAPSISNDELSIFFTRMTGLDMKIYVAHRDSVDEPFGEPEVLPIEGENTEGPSISVDGKSVYFHQKVNGQFQIYMLPRK